MNADDTPRNTYQDDTRWLEAERRTDATLFRRNLLVAVLVFGLAFAFFAKTVLARYAVPGQSADFVALATGLRVNFSFRFAVWRRLLAGFVALFPASSAAYAANLLCTFFSALAVSLAGLVVAQLTQLFADREHYETVVDGDPTNHIGTTSLLAGLATAAALAACPPYWTVAAQAHPQSFHLSWLLLSVLCALRFGATRRTPWLVAFAVLHGLGASQTPSFVAWAPVLILYAAWALWGEDRLTTGVFARICLLFAIPFVALLAWSAWAFVHSPGAELVHNDRFWKVLLEMAKELYRGIYSSFDRTWWLILLGLTVLPWLASLLAGRRALNGEGGYAMFALHLAIAATTLVVLLDLRYSPWQLDPFSFQILPYAMTAATFGYLVAALRAWIVHMIGSERKRRYARWTAAVAVLAALLALYFGWHNRLQPGVRQQRFVPMYADAVIDGMQGRPWLVTSGFFDSVILVRAHERGVPMHVIDASRPSSTIRTTADFRDALPDATMRNSADIGIVPLLGEWLSKRDDAPASLAFGVNPDFWHMGPWADYPSGPVHLGAAPAEVDALAATDLAAPAVAMLDAFDPVLDAVPTNAPPLVGFAAAEVRRQLSLSANNTAFLLEGHGRRTDAFELYGRVREFAPENVSATLNWIHLLEALHPDRKDEIGPVIEELRRHPSPHVWNLAAAFGYVSSPGTFAIQGLQWAVSGHSAPALYAMGQAIERVPAAEQNQFRARMAGLFLRTGNIEESEKAFLRVIEEDPGSRDAILGLFRIALVKGDFKAARDRLAEAREAGVSAAELLFETAIVEIAAGEPAKARAIANRMLGIDPDSKSAQILLANVAIMDYEKAEDRIGRNAALAALHKAVSELFRIAGPQDFQALHTRARAEMLEQSWAAAREDFLAALKAADIAVREGVAEPIDPTPLLDSILRMDFNLLDKTSAERHAKELLRRVPGHVFANWILGSINLEREELEAAEAFLEKALASAPDAVYVLNDLAMAKLQLGRHEAAEALVRRSFQTTRELSGPWDTLGCVLLARDDAEGARDAFETALELDQDSDPRIRLHLAQALLRLSEENKARSLVEALLRSRESATFKGQDARDFDDLVAALRVRR